MIGTEVCGQFVNRDGNTGDLSEFYFVGYAPYRMSNPTDFLHFSAISIERKVDLFPKALASRPARVNCLSATVEEYVNTVVFTQFIPQARSIWVVHVVWGYTENLIRSPLFCFTFIKSKEFNNRTENI